VDDVRDIFYRNGLVRSDTRFLAGVCTGIGRRIGLDPWPARMLFVLLLLVIPGSQLLVYPALWILMPDSAWVARRAAGSGPAVPST
jgi:phage shock protein C